MKSVLNFFSYLIIILPISIVTGPFLSDLIVSTSAIFFLIYSIKNKNYIYFNTIFFKLFFLFWVFIIISASFADEIFISLKSAIPYIRFALFVIFVLFLVNETKDFLRKFTISFLIFYCVVLFDSYFQFIFGFNILGFESPVENRLSSFFGDEMVVGSFLSRLFPLALFSILYLSKKYLQNIKYLSPILLILVDVIIFLSGERTSFGILLIINFGFIILISQMKYIRIVTFIISIILIGLISISNNKVKDRMIDQTINDIGLKKDQTYLFSKIHQDHYETAYKIFKDNILVGAGPKMFRYECSKKEFQSGKYSCTTHPHHLHLQILSETGIVGYLFILVALLWIIKIFISTIYLNYFKQKFIQNADLQNCILIGAFVNLFPFLPSGNFFNNWLSIIYFLPLGFYIFKKI